jgi:hypothetical protein
MKNILLLSIALVGCADSQDAMSTDTQASTGDSSTQWDFLTKSGTGYQVANAFTFSYPTSANEQLCDLGKGPPSVGMGIDMGSVQTTAIYVQDAFIYVIDAPVGVDPAALYLYDAEGDQFTQPGSFGPQYPGHGTGWFKTFPVNRWFTKLSRSNPLLLQLNIATGYGPDVTGSSVCGQTLTAVYMPPLG